MFQTGHSAIEMFQGGCSDHAWSVSIEILTLYNIMYLGFFSMGLAGASWATDSHLFLFQTVIAYREMVCNTRQEFFHQA